MIHALFYARVCCGKHHVVGVHAAADAGYFLFAGFSIAV